jgi:hypothetical protein
MQLADNEKVVQETPFGLGPTLLWGGTATLTDRRIIFAARDFEESIPLRALTSVRCSFARDFARAAWGAVILALAIGFGAGYKSLETVGNGVALAIEKRVTEKQPASEAYGQYVNISASLVWLLMLPLIGWGAVKLGAGLIGETELMLSTASGHAGRTRYGRQRELMEFAEEAGRRTGGAGL